MSCPKCGSYYIVKNGISLSNSGCCSTPNRNINVETVINKFVLNPEKHISEEKKAIIDKLLLEKISLEELQEVWVFQVFGCKNRLRKNIKSNQKNFMFKKSRGKLEVEVDELWSFVGKKHNKQWVWLAFDRRSREIIAYHVGGRIREDARKFWQSFPPVYRYVQLCGVLPHP